MEPQNPPPVYAPETVAEAILHCAENPERDLYVGGGGKVLAEAGRIAPRLTDKLMEATMFDVQKSDRPKADRVGAIVCMRLRRMEKSAVIIRDTLRSRVFTQRRRYIH